MTISYTDQLGSVSTLTINVDYKFEFEMKGVSSDATNSIFGAIKLLNTSLDGTLTIAYHALGGAWQFIFSAVNAYLSESSANLQIAEDFGKFVNSFQWGVGSPR